MDREVSSPVSPCYLTPGSYAVSPQQTDNPHRDVFPRDLGMGGGKQGAVCQSVPKCSEKDNREPKQGARARPEADGCLLSSPRS